MGSKAGNTSKVRINSFDDLFGGADNTAGDQVINAKLSDLNTFKGHPFCVLDDKKMEKFKLENLYDDDESFDSIISQCTEDLSLIKKKYYETKAEIKAMYPKLTDNIIEKICFSNFFIFCI